MTFEKNPTTKTYKKINDIETVQTVQAKVDLANLKNILSCGTTALVKKYEHDGEHVTAQAIATFKVLYITEDNSFASAETTSEFTFTLAAPVANYFRFNLQEVETTVDATNPTEAVVCAKFNVKVAALSQSDFAGVKPGTEGAIEKIDTVTIQTIGAIADDKLAVSYETEITANSVLCCEANVALTSATATTDAVLVEGELYANILTEIDGNLKQTFKTIEFSGEVSALGLKPNSVVDVRACIENITATLENGGTNATLQLAATVAINGECYQNEEIEVVTDAYTENKELIITTNGMELSSVLETKYKQKEVGVVLQTKDKSVNMGTILAVCAPKFDNGNIVCNVIYRHAETDEILSTLMFAAAEELNACYNLLVKSFAKKRAKEVLVELEATTVHTEQNEQYIVYASEIEEGNDIEDTNKGIVVYAAKKGQELFDVAKALCVRPEILKTQNEALEDILQEDRKIIYYKPLYKQF